MKCPDGHDAKYQLFSGGREMYCKTCDDSFEIPEDQMTHRLKLLHTEEGRLVLREELDAEIARQQRLRERQKRRRV